MTREQRRLTEAMRATASDFAALARKRDEFVGGMQWLPAKGKEYLTRYRRDPLSGEQKSTSLGRRSAETEVVYERFIEGRADLDREIEELRPTMAEQTRMAKALRLSRTPTEIADVVRAIGHSDVFNHVTIIGEAAVYGYECELAALLPRELLPEGGMDLLVAGVHPSDAIDEVAAALRRGRVGIRRGRGDFELRTEENVRIRLFTASMLERNAELYAEENHNSGEAAQWALEQPPIRSICIDRQGRAAPFSLLDPRAYCILRYVTIDTEEMSLIARDTSSELNSSMVHLVQENWPEPFEEKHVTSIGKLAEALVGEQFHPRPRF
jgi:hypothetical protein